MSSHIKHRITLVFGLLALAVSGVSNALVIDPNALDPAVLHIGPGYGTSCATGGCPLYNNEVNAVGQKTLDIYYNSTGGEALQSPVYLILGVANDATHTVFDSSSISGVTLHNGASTPVSVGNVNFGGLFEAPVTNPPPDVYSTLGFVGGDNSNSFGNWHDWELAINGINASNFGLYTIELMTDAFAGGNTLNINFLNDLPIGTFAVGYGAGPIPTQGNQKIYTTPFTEAGLETSSSSSSSSTSGGASSGQTLPEPATLPLMIVGLLGLVAAGRRFTRSAT